MQIVEYRFWLCVCVPTKEIVEYESHKHIHKLFTYDNQVYFLSFQFSSVSHLFLLPPDFYCLSLASLDLFRFFYLFCEFSIPYMGPNQLPQKNCHFHSFSHFFDCLNFFFVPSLFLSLSLSLSLSLFLSLSLSLSFLLIFEFLNTLFLIH